MIKPQEMLQQYLEAIMKAERIAEKNQLPVEDKYEIKRQKQIYVQAIRAIDNAENGKTII